MYIIKQVRTIRGAELLQKNSIVTSTKPADRNHLLYFTRKSSCTAGNQNVKVSKWILDIRSFKSKTNRYSRKLYSRALAIQYLLTLGTWILLY